MKSHPSKPEVAEDPDPFEIDLGNLERDWVEHVRYARKAMRRAADAKADQLRAEAELKLVEAEQQERIRLHPEKFGMADPTEKAIASAVIRTKAYQKAQEAAITARHFADVCQADVNALSHKKKGLEDVVTLFMAGYFARPKNRNNKEARWAQAHAFGGRDANDDT